MKALLTLTTFAALTLALAWPASTFAAEKKAKAAAATPAATPAPEKKPADSAGGAATDGMKMSMFVKVGTIDAATKTFTHTNKDGAVVKFIVTEKTEIKNGEMAAKFEDLKVGDTVSGSRIKKSATEYEVVKISKFGPKMEKAEKPVGEAKDPAKPEAK